MYRIHHLQVVLQTRKHRLTKRYALVLSRNYNSYGVWEWRGRGWGGGGGLELLTIYSAILGSGGGFIYSYSRISSSQ